MSLTIYFNPYPSTTPLSYIAFNINRNNTIVWSHTITVEENNQGYVVSNLDFEENDKFVFQGTGGTTLGYIKNHCPFTQSGRQGSFTITRLSFYSNRLCKDWDSRYINQLSGDEYQNLYYQSNIYDLIETNTYFNNRENYTKTDLSKTFSILNGQNHIQYTPITSNFDNIFIFDKTYKLLKPSQIGFQVKDEKIESRIFIKKNILPMLIQTENTYSLNWGRILIQNYDWQRLEQVYYIERFKDPQDNLIKLKIWSVDNNAFQSFYYYTDSNQPLQNNQAYIIPIPEERESIVLDIQAAGGYGNKLHSYNEMFNNKTIDKAFLPMGGSGGGFIRLLINLSQVLPIKEISLGERDSYLQRITPGITRYLKIILRYNTENYPTWNSLDASNPTNCEFYISDTQCITIPNGFNAMDMYVNEPFDGENKIHPYAITPYTGSTNVDIIFNNPNYFKILLNYKGGCSEEVTYSTDDYCSSIHMDNYYINAKLVFSTKTSTIHPTFSILNESSSILPVENNKYYYWKNLFSCSQNTYNNNFTSLNTKQMIFKGVSKWELRWHYYNSLIKSEKLPAGGCSYLGIVNTQNTAYIISNKMSNHCQNKMQNFGIGGSGEIGWLENNIYNCHEGEEFSTQNQYWEYEGMSIWNNNGINIERNSIPGPACFILHW